MNNRSHGVYSFPAYAEPDLRRAGETPRCSFCRLGEGQVAHLFEGRAGYICNECVEVCGQLLADYRAMGFRPSPVKAPWYRRWLAGGEALAACDFCGVAYGASERLLAGLDSRICEKCVRTCEAIGADDF
jgi:hypothetical protein